MKLNNLFGLVAAAALFVTSVGCGDTTAPVIDAPPADAPATTTDPATTEPATIDLGDQADTPPSDFQE